MYNPQLTTGAILKKNLRLLVVDDKADEVSVVRGTVALPGQFDPCTAGAVGLKLQDGAFTCREKSYNQSTYILMFKRAANSLKLM